MSRLRFDYCEGDNKWTFTNQTEEIVGWFERIRIGAWMHWCYFLRDGFYLSPGCADEVRDFQRKLGSQKTSEEKK